MRALRGYYGLVGCGDGVCMNVGYFHGCYGFGLGESLEIVSKEAAFGRVAKAGL